MSPLSLSSTITTIQHRPLRMAFLLNPGFCPMVGQSPAFLFVLLRTALLCAESLRGVCTASKIQQWASLLLRCPVLLQELPGCNPSPCYHASAGTGCNLWAHFSDWPIKVIILARRLLDASSTSFCQTQQRLQRALAT